MNKEQLENKIFAIAEKLTNEEIYTEPKLNFVLMLKINSEELKNKLNEIGCEKWLSKACKIPKKIGIRELFDPKYLIEIENNFYRYIIENYKEIDIKRENIIFEWKTL